MLAAGALTRNTSQITAAAAAAIALRVLRRLIRKVLLSPSTWIILAVAVSLAIVANVRTLQWTLAAPAHDAADQYVQSLKSGDVDAFLASLSPEARTELGVFGRHVTEAVIMVMAEVLPTERVLPPDEVVHGAICTTADRHDWRSSGPGAKDGWMHCQSLLSTEHGV